MHALAALADKAIRSLQIHLERAEIEGTEIEVWNLLETVAWWENQKQEVDRR